MWSRKSWRCWNFNPHPRTEGDLDIAASDIKRANFNPHPRTEGDRRTVRFHGGLEISTHTLARRVTNA